MTSDPVTLTDIDNPKAWLVIEDPADLTVKDNIYNEGVCIRLDRGTNNSIRENSVVHPEGVSKGYPGAGIGLGWDTEIDREAVSCFSSA